jgi:hypothetical protein
VFEPIGDDFYRFVGFAVARLFFRMLDPWHELAPVMGFPRTYKWPTKKSVVTKLVGNAVHVDLADAVTSVHASIFAPTPPVVTGEAAA